MATYRIVDMYRKSKAIKGIHYDSQNNPILAYRVDKRHSLLFGLIHYWDYGAYNLCPDYLFSSIDKAEEAILKVDKSRRVTIILYKQLMKIKDIKFKAKRLDGKGWVCGYFYEENDNTYIIEDGQKESKLNRNLTYQVDPSTVCMFTGLTDCEGKELFEHDLIHFVGYKPIGEVIWSEENYAFMAASENKLLYWLSDVLEIGKIERVGNKFDKEK